MLRKIRFLMTVNNDDYDGTESLNRAETRALLKSLRAWVEDRLRGRTEQRERFEIPA